MGDPRRKHKKYVKPKKPFEKERIREENLLLKKYGLKNKRELWKAEFRIANIRRQAKVLLNKEQAKQDEFLNKLKLIGLKVKSVDDVLALNKESLLERRLQTIVFRKKLANSIKHARQLIVHKHVSIAGKVVNKPSFIVPVKLENKIKLMNKSKKETKK
jgi:small subunit ribosomal protein S4